MVLSDDIFLRIAVFVLAVAGFFVARHIRQHKDSNKNPLVCMVGFDCDAVVHSNYSKFLGIHLDLLGVIYYAVMSVFYFILVFMPEILPLPLVGVLLLGSLGAFLFSIYLVCIQIFVLKKGCSWCLTEASISVVIFILNVFAYDFIKILQTFFH